MKDWFDSPVPLVGICGGAGAGKTGVLASVVNVWHSKDEQRIPVLFLLANQHVNTGSLDRIVEEALHLTGAPVDKIAEAVNGLLIVIDGINEHPKRDDLLSTILAHALRTKNGALVGTTGARFMLVLTL